MQLLAPCLQTCSTVGLDQVPTCTGRMVQDRSDWRLVLHTQFDVRICVFPVNKPSITDVDIRMIKPGELKYEYPKEPFMKTSTSQVYRGEYHGFKVAIKRFTDPVDTSARSAATHPDTPSHRPIEQR